MLESTLPDRIKPVKFAKRNSSFVGKWPLEKFSRLAADTVAASGEVSIDAAFSYDEGFPSLCGKLKADVQLQCQRCLEPVIVPLSVEINVAFVVTEERLENLPEPYEGVLLEEDEISIVEVVEQELILALPIVAYHEQCDFYPYHTEEEKAESSAKDSSKESQSENPFSVLAELKGKLKTDDSKE
ncbi:MAG: YceD family protein [Pseudomonadales bacterium]|nr:YceD family protein [Pseudomonadales bacterium]